MKVQVFVAEPEQLLDDARFLGHADHSELGDVFDTLQATGIYLGDWTKDDIDWRASAVQFVDRKREVVAVVTLVANGG